MKSIYQVYFTRKQLLAIYWCIRFAIGCKPFTESDEYDEEALNGAFEQIKRGVKA